MTYRVVDRQHDGHSTVQLCVLHLSFPSVRIEHSYEGGVLRLGGRVDTAPHLTGVVWTIIFIGYYCNNWDTSN